MSNALLHSLPTVDAELERCLLEDWKRMSDDPALGLLDFEEFRAGYVGFECWYREGFSVLVLTRAS
jgi:hypothetical protein